MALRRETEGTGGKFSRNEMSRSPRIYLQLGIGNGFSALSPPKFL